MLDFLLELERVLKVWPDNVKWNIIQLADYTHTRIHVVVDAFSEVLNKALDVHEPLSFNEVSKAHGLLLEKNRAALEARKREEWAATQRSMEAYERTMEKVRVMQATKNWRSAYRTLSYFFGNHKDRLPKEHLVALLSDCLHLGTKGDAHYQELCQWLRQAMQILLSSPSPDHVEDALDLVDAYGAYFMDNGQGKGEQFLTNIFLALKPAAMEFNLTPRLNLVASELNITRVLDVVS